jgi:hypothetical protein
MSNAEHGGSSQHMKPVPCRDNDSEFLVVDSLSPLPAQHSLNYIIVDNDG